MPKPVLSATKAGRKSGKRFANQVHYRRPTGRWVDAMVVGGSGTSLNLRLVGYPQATRELTGIAKMTSRTQVNVWR